MPRHPPNTIVGKARHRTRQGKTGAALSARSRPRAPSTTGWFRIYTTSSRKVSCKCCNSGTAVGNRTIYKSTVLLHRTRTVSYTFHHHQQQHYAAKIAILPRENEQNFEKGLKTRLHSSSQRSRILFRADDAIETIRTRIVAINIGNASIRSTWHGCR